MTHTLQRSLLALLCLILSLTLHALPRDIIFHNLSTTDGLSNSQVNDICRDSRGYIWMATQSGLNRYDGFHFKVFFNDPLDDRSLPNNYVFDVKEAADGHLWVHTGNGYSIYDALTENFQRDLTPQLKQWKVEGGIDRLEVDENKNLWLAVPQKGVYYVEPLTGRSHLVQIDKSFAHSSVTSMTSRGNMLLVSFNDGRMLGINTKTFSIVWRSNFPVPQPVKGYENFRVRIDYNHNYWVATNGRTSIYCSSEGRWYDSVNDFLISRGYRLPFSEMLLVKDVAEIGANELWIATDHQGLLHLDGATKEVRQYLYDNDEPTSIANNTIESLFVDPRGALWVGCYKNGISYYSPSQSRFSTVSLGDICTIVEDQSGKLWLGTDDSGIIEYDPLTGNQRRFTKEQTGMGSDVVISSVMTRDGSLWFGGFNAGLARYRNGQWTVFRANGQSGLMSDNVWTLSELPDGRIAIGTLGAGLQLLDAETMKWTNYTTQRYGLASDYISSLFVNSRQQVVVAMSEKCSVLDLKTGKVSDYALNANGEPLQRSQINQVFEDSRGLLWLATSSGTIAYDMANDKTYSIDGQMSLTGSVACAVTEDKDHNIWIVNDHGVSRVMVTKTDKEWDFFTTSFNSLDGLQPRQFNFRSILLTRRGEVAIGGQDGLNILPRQQFSKEQSKAKVLFSGLVLFDHALSVGEEYDGHIVLHSSLNEAKELKLQAAENAFSIQLGTSEMSLPEKTRFMYRLKGFSDKWLYTNINQGNVTFTGMSPGHYVLEARVVTRYGTVSDEVSRLAITIAPPLYATWWAITLYLLALAGLAWYVRTVVVRRQRIRLKMQQMEMEAERTKQVDEMKLTFFTNVSHELRTPLSLIITPLSTLLQKETDPEKHNLMQLMYNNAQRLLGMVTEVLDFRKIDKEKESLNLVSGDLVSYVRYVTDEVKQVYNKEVTVSFYSPMKSLIMAFDADKLRKIISNLLSNALKYTPQPGGKIEVIVQMADAETAHGAAKAEQMVTVRVADNGIGISDDDKQHIFERFYQAGHKDSPYGGTGVGLHIVANYTRLHGGSVSVDDNPGGGTVFTIALPIHHDATLPHLSSRFSMSPSAPAAAAADALILSDDDAEQSPEDAGRKEVLIVDDSTDFLQFMAGELTRQFRVRTATNGREALDRISEHKPDIILCDVMMPEMDGNELCRRLKANKETLQIPIIMLTARLAEEHQMESMQQGADDYLTKPFNLDLLYLRMENLIKWRDAAPDEKSGKMQAELKPIVITSLDQQLVKRATAYVDENISDTTITVETMAQELGISRVQLYKKLLSITGSTPSEFIRQIRLRRAEQLLRESQYSVSEVAYKVGFNIPRYFTKYFKEMYGVNPSQYKSRNGKGQA